MSEIMLAPSAEVAYAWELYWITEALAPAFYDLVIYYQYNGYVADNDTDNYNESVPTTYLGWFFGAPLVIWNVIAYNLFPWFWFRGMGAVTTWAKLGHWLQWFTVYQLEVVVVVLGSLFLGGGGGGYLLLILFEIFPHFRVGFWIKTVMLIVERIIMHVYYDGYLEYIEYQKWAYSATEEEIAASEAAGAAAAEPTEDAVEETAEESTEVSETEEAAAEDTAFFF